MGNAPDPVNDGAVRYGGLSDSLGFLLRLAQLQSFADFFRTFEGEEVRPGEISVLMVLYENPGIRQGLLARALSIKRAHMTKMVRQMEADGLITRRVPEDDKRAMELRLTALGQARVKALMPIFADHESRDSRCLDRAEAAELKRLLRKLLDLPLEDGNGAPDK
ncbi:MarR family winged helix-turn-helix transcriptional regulator [Antarctobacter heliothermus]|uniref:DNA-binding transcriptional regulator, MarR family n=1 Tax=Antarctobacter heliothermus TaxID=74033 RepID=A0A239B283_9RHOB|nr:MarR family transcriptional regulator [Antarctobacter heliothermus]SNS02066.1 DNA-binding transcriptional regulator, MarR family [Antarctobacter heliothermus]